MAYRIVHCDISLAEGLQLVGMRCGTEGSNQPRQVELVDGALRYSYLSEVGKDLITWAFYVLRTFDEVPRGLVYFGSTGKYHLYGCDPRDVEALGKDGAYYGEG